VKLDHVFRKILFVLFLLLTLVVVICECGSYWNLRYNFLSVALHSSKVADYLPFNLVCLIPLGYICLSANYGIIYLKFFKLYALHDHGMTEPSNLVYCGQLLTKLAVSVAYNFISLTGLKDCAFFQVLGPLQSIAFLGPDFNRYVFPSCLFIMMFMTIFHVYDWFMNRLGVQKFDFDPNYA
jgi:hypothetical protein